MREPEVLLKTYTCTQYRQWVGRKETHESAHRPSTFSEAELHKVYTDQGLYTTTWPCRTFHQTCPFQELRGHGNWASTSIKFIVFDPARKREYVLCQQLPESLHDQTLYNKNDVKIEVMVDNSLYHF